MKKIKNSMHVPIEVDSNGFTAVVDEDNKGVKAIPFVQVTKNEDGTFSYDSSSGGEAGKSAYDIAVDNGFEGTEEEWLESLQGQKGDAFTYSDFTTEQLASLKGEKGDAFTYEDFTSGQLESLKGTDGQDGVSITGATSDGEKITFELSNGSTIDIPWPIQE